MPDEQVQNAEPSTAIVEQSINDVVQSMTPEQRQEWKLTGKIPEAPVVEDSEASDTAKEQATEEVDPSKTVAESDTALDEQDDKPKPKGGIHKLQKRVDTLTGRNHTLADENTDLREQLKRLEAIERQLADKSAPAEKSKASDNDPKPKVDDFATYDDYVEALAGWKSSQTLKADREKVAKEATDTEREKVFADYNHRVEDARGRYEDFDTVVGRPIPLGANQAASHSAQVAIVEMENGPDVAYALGSDPDLANQLAEIASPVKAIAFLTRLSDRLAKEAEPEKPETTSAVPTRKRVTSAPPPPVQVSGRSISPEDEADAALRRGDSDAYKRIMNARDVARSKG